ncbi:MAG: extracellular solute-binding protein [Fimbriimonas sp.]
MRRSTFALAALLVLAAIGCGPKTEETPTGTGGGEVASNVKQAPTGEGEVKGEIEVQAFKGGYGIDFYQQAAKEFDEKNGTKTTVDGGPRVWEQLRTRFVANTPPDLTFPGWDMDHWALADEGQLFGLDDALKSKPYEGEGTWGDTFNPALLKMGQANGKQMVLPYYYMVMGWWYDPGVFQKNGWTVPKTYDELLVLCEKIKAKGMAPITFQGKYPYYMITGMLMPWARSIGGKDAVTAAQNLEPGAWKSEAFLKAAKMIDELNKKGYFQQGAVAMSHTDSQQEFLQGKAAMIPCGTWLESEMSKMMPPGAQMAFMLPPVVSGGAGDPTSVIIAIEPWMVPSKGKNPNGAVALYKYMTSLTKAKQFVEQKGTLMAINGSDEVKLPKTLVEPARVVKESKDAWAQMYREWYRAFEKEIENAMTAMLNGELTPEQFCDRVEAEAQKTKNDPDVIKRKVD